MRPAADIVVVGAGVIGASIAVQLARRGRRRVIVCEQNRHAGHAATAQSGGILRVHHTADCDVELAVRSLPVFQAFRQIYGSGCGYVPAGFALLVGPAQVEALEHNLSTVQAAGGKVEVLTGGELTARFPGLAPNGIAAAAFEPDGGFADPALAARAMLTAAVSAGAEVLDGVSVEGLLAHDDEIAGVRTNLGDIAGSSVVIAAGSWSSAIARTVDVDLPITPRWIGLGFSRAPVPAGYDVPACIDDTLGTYFRPADAPGLYFGTAVDDRAAGLGSPAGRVRREPIDTALRDLLIRVPGLADGQIRGSRLGVDGYSPDRRPVIGPVGPDGLYLATGMSGGGFKIAPAVGELVATELLTGRAQPALAPYRWQRFSAGEPVAPQHPYQWM